MRGGVYLPLTQLLTNLPATRVSDLDQWLPDQWKRRDTPRRGDGWG
jgi:hypothetical protein